ncbi:MAG TPA: ATP-binding protein [Gemmatimonadaceae bacterium]|nr:ATP-binding protein [Gemmatimonadaceae bacterium]
MLLAIGFGVDLWTRSRLIESQREDIMLRLQPYSNTISIGLRRRLERLNGLKAFVEGAHSLNDVNREFPVLAQGLLQGASGVRALELLKDGRVRWVYPLKGNEKALNLDVLNDPRPEVSRPVERLSETDSVVMSGPVTLAQGGVGLIARQHIRTHDRSLPDAATVVVDVDSLLSVAGMLHGVQKLDVALLDRAGRRMGTEQAPMPPNPVRVDVTIPDGHFTIVGSPVGGWNAAVAGSLLGIRAAGLMIILLFAGLVYLILERQSSLTAGINERTRELQLANQELGREVQVRLDAEAALRRQEEQLLHAQKMEAVGTLAGGIAHDFNNVLTAIIGFGGLALDRTNEFAAARGESEDIAGIRHDVEEILRASQHAAVVTNQLLAFSRKQVARPEALDVGWVVRDIEGLLQRLIGERVRLETRMAENLPNVFVDRGQLTQVIVNLAVNARDAMPEGGSISIDASLKHVRAGTWRSARGVPDGEYVEIKFQDSGHGMPPEVLARVFEPFYTTKGLGKGTGLGLSTVYGIIGRIGGRVLVDSEEGKGSIFRVLLPPHHAEPVAVAPVLERPSADARSETILLAEDEPAVRQLATRVLSRLGFTVIAAGSGEEAIALGASHNGRVDLLLTDLVMPGVNGRVTAERLRSQRPGLRVLFMSGYSEEVAKLHDFDGGRSTLLSKPFTPDALARRVREVLDRA